MSQGDQVLCRRPMDNSFKFDKNISIPRNTPTLASIVRRMKVGDSFVWPRDKVANAYSAAKKYGFEIVTRKVSPTDVRVWRIEETKP